PAASVSLPKVPWITVFNVAALSRSALVVPAATPTTTAPSAPCTSATPSVVLLSSASVPPVSTLPVAGPGVPAATLSMSATAGGTSSCTLMLTVPVVVSPSVSVATTPTLPIELICAPLPSTCCRLSLSIAVTVTL